MWDAEVDIVDHRGQQIEPAAILAPDDRVAEQPGIERLLAADQVGPGNRRVMLEPEAPVRRAAFGRRRIGWRALVNRGQSASQEYLAAKFELLRRLEAGIDSPGRLEPLELALIQREALGLAHDTVGREAEPVEIVANAQVERRGRALGVGVVDPQQECAVLLAREQIIMERGTDVADMQAPGRRRREAGGDGHAARSFSMVGWGWLRARARS